ncbi:hypothetical protein [Lacibacter sp. H407]|uniref:hypothetical protein n=1 Tax=Lacibacter sp. H407 TaxID=3133423 RepID=UPI0030C60974
MKLDERKLPIVLAYYENGDDKFTISGQTYHGKNLQNFKIFSNDKEVDLNEFEKHCRQQYLIRKNIIGFYYPEEALVLLGKDKTEDFIGDYPFGHKKQLLNTKYNKDLFVNLKRIEELKNLPNNKFDFSRLVRLCEEINDTYSRGNFLSVGMIGRTILHHIPPIFNLSSFDEVANNYGGPKENKSFKKNMTHLNESLKNIADGFLHTQIRKAEILPNETQVDFRQDLDSLLGEIVRISK